MAIDRALVGSAMQALLAHPTNATAKLDGPDAGHRAAIAKTAVQLAAEAQAACDAYDGANATTAKTPAAGPAKSQTTGS